MRELSFWPLVCLSALTLSAQVRVDYGGAEAWLARAKEAPNRPASWEAASAATDGGQLAEAAWSGFGPLPQDLPAMVSPADLAAFLEQLKQKNLDVLEGQIRPWFPILPALPVEVAVVANGFPTFADLYVRHFDRSGGRLLVTESGGRCVVVVNACQVAAAGYGKSADERAENVTKVIRHEIFHVYYQRFRASRAGAKAELSPSEDLLITTQNEGMAHYLADHQELRRAGFDWVRGGKALQRLEGTVLALREHRAGPELLRAANQGPFWDKYAAIAGMLFCYGVDQEAGPEGLRACLLEGPASLVARYALIAASHADWPQPGPEVMRWARELRNLR